MIGVTYEGDKIWLLLPGRRRDVLLSCGQAEAFAAALRRVAASAEREPPSVVRGEVWEVGVQSYDGAVAVRFLPPFPGNLERVPLPVSVALALAERVTFKAQQAAHRMRLEFSTMPPAWTWPNWGLDRYGRPKETRRRPPWRQRRIVR